MLLPSEKSYTNILCLLCKNKITYEEVSVISSPCIIGNPIPSSYMYKCFNCKKGYSNEHKWDYSLFPDYPNHENCPCNEMD